MSVLPSSIDTLNEGRKMSRRRFVVACGSLILATMLASCASRRTVYPVKGKIIYSGESLEGAVIAFHPADAKSDGPVPYGVIQRDGSFQLSTYGPNDGAPAGSYRVTVTLDIIPENGEREDAYPSGPQRYASLDTTDLTAEVPSGGGELPAFTLSKD